MVEEIIIRELDSIERWLIRIYDKLIFYYPHHPRCKKHPNRQKVKQVLIAIINNQKFIIMEPLVQQVGTPNSLVSALVDAASLLPIAGATKVFKSSSFDDAAVATVDSLGNLVPVAPGNGNVTVINTWIYKDSITGDTVTADETTVQAVQVKALPEGVLQVVTLGPAIVAAS